MKIFLYLLKIVAFIGSIGPLNAVAKEEILGTTASILIPDTWLVVERTSSSLSVKNPSGSVEIIISHFVPDIKNSVTGGSYSVYNSILEWYLNSHELSNMKDFFLAGFPITNIQNGEFSAGASNNNDLYTSRVIRNFSFSYNSLEYDCTLTTQYSTDGSRGFLISNYVYNWVTDSELNEAIQTIDSLRSSRISSPLSDTDGDGINNFDESILHGTNPEIYNDPDSVVHQGPTITSDLSSISLPAYVSSPPYAVTNNFGASSFTASGLPTGMKIDASTGVITGIPKRKGIFRIRITAKKKEGRLITQSVMATKIVTVY